MSVDFKAKFSGSAETFSATMSEAPAGMTASMKGTGGGTASNYQTLRNKPRINGVELSGDLTAEELGTLQTSTTRTSRRRLRRSGQSPTGSESGRL